MCIIEVTTIVMMVQHDHLFLVFQAANVPGCYGDSGLQYGLWTTTEPSMVLVYVRRNIR